MKKNIAVCLVIAQALFLTGCVTTTMERYRIEPVQEVVTKYRDVQQPYVTEVDVPYQEEVQVPQYKVVQEPLLKSSTGPIAVAFLPFTSSTADPSDGANLAFRLESVILRQPAVSKKYRVVRNDAIREALGKTELSRLTVEDFAQLRAALNLDILMTGHIKSMSSDAAAFNLEALDVRTTRARFMEYLSGSYGTSEQRLVEIFFGKRVVSGTKNELVTKYRKEPRTEYRTVKEPYQETVTVQKRVRYWEKVPDKKMTIFVWSLGIGGVLWFMFAPKLGK